MNKMKQIAVSLLGLVLLSSCGSMMQLNVAKRATEIHAGMTADEVQKIMGRPEYRRFDATHDDWEQWEYKGMFFDDARDIVIVDFHNGRVVSLNSFSEQRYTPPTPPAAHEQ